MRFFILFCFLTGSMVETFAQTPTAVLPKVIGPSPSVSSIQESGKYDVSTYRGLANVSIPVYDIKLKDLTVPISISYLGQGIKVDEESSRVGLGWSLNAGGIISRKILGLDDIISKSLYPNSFDLYGYPQKNLIATVFLPFAAYTYDISNKISTGQYDPTHPFLAVDLEPDIFTYNILGESGKFILRKKDTSAIFEEASTNMSVKFIIKHLDPQVSGLNDSCRIIVIDAKGTIYNFDQFETCETFGPTSVPVYITAWYLTKIQSINGETVDFHYEQSSTGYTYTLNHPSDYVFLFNGFNIKKSLIPHHKYKNVLLTSISFPGGSIAFDYSSRIDIQGGNRLISIIINDLNGQMTRKINLLQDYFTANSSKSNTFDLGSSLWGGSTLDSNWIKKRLKLTGLTEISSDNQEILSYKFDYEENLLPFKNSTSRDDWGYFNNADNGDNLIPDLYFAYPGLIRQSVPPEYNCTPFEEEEFGSNNELYSESVHNYYIHHLGANRNIDTNYSDAFMLKEITFPTGGKEKFTYGQNTYDPANSFVNDENASLYDFEQKDSQLAFLTGVSYVPNNYSQSFPFNVSSEDILPGENAALINFKFKAQITNIVSSPVNNLSYVRLRDSNGNTVYELGFNSLSGFINEGSNIYSLSFPLQRLSAGSYSIEFFISGNTVDKSSIIYTVTGKWYKSNTGTGDGIKYKYAGGLRIKNISMYTPFDSLLASTDYLYHFTSDKNHNGIPETYSTGKLLERPSYFGVDLADSNKIFLKSEADINTNIGYDSVVTVQHNIKHMDVYYNNAYRPVKYLMYYTYSGNEMMPGFAAFPAAIITGLGLPNNHLYLNIYFDYKPEGLKNFVDNGNGKLIKSIDYSYDTSSGLYSIIRKIENEYTGTGNGIDVVWADRIIYHQIAGGFLNDSGAIIGQCLKGLPIMYGVFNYFYPSMRSAAVLLSQQKETEYFPGDSIMTLTNYSYNSHELLESKALYNSRGEKTITHYSYPLDYSVGDTPSSTAAKGIKTLQDRHVISSVVEQYIQRSKANETNLRTVSATLNTYKPAVPLPDLSYTLQLPEASISFIPTVITGTEMTKDANYKPEVSFDNYDTYGNILQQHKINDANHSYIWDYQHKYPIAEAVNASQSSIAYTSFEADGKGNWNFSGTPSATGGFITGSKSYSLGSGSISKSGLTSSEKYIVSYWLKSGGSLSISGGTQSGSITGRTINGWTYHQVTITGATSISLSGSGYVDELRLYPSDAQMTTYTYDPLIGMTSQCDANNKILYYEYDGFSRLQDIKDEDGNIIKTFEYHYKQ